MHRLNLKVGLVLVALIALFSICARSQTEENTPFVHDGNQLLRSCQSTVRFMDGDPKTRESDFDSAYCIGYVSGVQDIFIISRLLMNKDGSGTAGLFGTCPPIEPITVGQLARIYVRWLLAHPEILHQKAYILDIQIMHDSFPCPSAATPKEEKKK